MRSVCLTVCSFALISIFGAPELRSAPLGRGSVVEPGQDVSTRDRLDALLRIQKLVSGPSAAVTPADVENAFKVKLHQDVVPQALDSDSIGPGHPFKVVLNRYDQDVTLVLEFGDLHAETLYAPDLCVSEREAEPIFEAGGWQKSSDQVALNIRQMEFRFRGGKRRLLLTIDTRSSCILNLIYSNWPSLGREKH